MRQRLARLFAYAYVVGLVLVTLGMRYVGERFWLTTLLLYLPRLGWILPLPVVVLVLFAVRERRLGIALSIGVPLVVVFPLMGYRIHFFSHEPQTLRVMTWNTFLGRNDNEGIYEDVQLEQPDIFVSQASAPRTRDLFKSKPAGYEVASADEFFIATKLPILDVQVPPRIDAKHPSAWVRYTLQSKDGPIDFFIMHPRSPREGVQDARGTGLRARLKDLGLMGESVDHVIDNTRLRENQVRSLVDAVRASGKPYLIAGDSNLPSLSRLYNTTLGALPATTEAFESVGSGFGYTFPAKVPWMRIDRVLASSPFRFLRVRDGGELASDHRYVIADLSR